MVLDDFNSFYVIAYIFLLTQYCYLFFLLCKTVIPDIDHLNCWRWNKREWNNLFYRNKRTKEIPYLSWWDKIKTLPCIPTMNWLTNVIYAVGNVLNTRSVVFFTSWTILKPITWFLVIAPSLYAHGSNYTIYNHRNHIVIKT